MLTTHSLDPFQGPSIRLGTPFLQIRNCLSYRSFHINISNTGAVVLAKKIVKRHPPFSQFHDYFPLEKGLAFIFISIYNSL